LPPIHPRPLRAACFAVAALAALLASSVDHAAARSGGGISSFSGPAVVPGAAATLIGGRAIPPAEAPPAVVAAIRAANRIRAQPYVWGGGHGRWASRGYDCSGAVSFALHGGVLLETPLDSGSMMAWGEPGPGAWITIYANRRHAFAEIAGLRWDTSGDPRGVTGPRWHLAEADSEGFVVRHPVGY
jgi:cell wall-associated NlpC family hydrolase